MCLRPFKERTGCSPARSMSSVQARGYFSAFHLAWIDVSNFAQSTVLPRSASCNAAPMSSPPPDGRRSEPSKRTAVAFATCAASRLASSFGYAVAGTDLTGALTDESVQGSLPLKSWSYLSGPAWRTYTLSNQSVRVHESPAPSPSGVWPFALRSVSSFVNEFQSVAADTPAVLNLSGRNHTVLLLLNFTMIAYWVPST